MGLRAFVKPENDRKPFPPMEFFTFPSISVIYFKGSK
jgi:hypothetical protein